MASPIADAEFWSGLAGSLGGIGAILLGIALELAGPLFGIPGGGGAIAFAGFAIAVAGGLAGAISVYQMERALRRPRA